MVVGMASQCSCVIKQCVKRRQRNRPLPFKGDTIPTGMSEGMAPTIKTGLALVQATRPFSGNSRTGIHQRSYTRVQIDNWLSLGSLHNALTAIHLQYFCLITFFKDMVIMRFFPTIRSQIQRLLQNPFERAILFRGLWRLIRPLIFRR